MQINFIKVAQLLGLIAAVTSDQATAAKSPPSNILGRTSPQEAPSYPWWDDRAAISPQVQIPDDVVYSAALASRYLPYEQQDDRCPNFTVEYPMGSRQTFRVSIVPLRWAHDKPKTISQAAEQACYDAIPQYLAINEYNVERYVHVGKITGELELSVGGGLWFVTSPKTRLSSVGSIGQQAARRNIIMGLANGLNNLHKRGIILAGLNPDYVWLDRNGAASVGDWGRLNLEQRGIVQLSGGGAESAVSRCEELRYQAPEVIKKDDITQEPITAAADVYSFGCIMYYIFTGRHLWTGFQSEYRLAQAKVNGQIPPIKIEDGNYTTYITNLLTRCLTTRPENRPTMEQVVTYLARIWYSCAP
ncbi:MAG: protein kinase [Holosporales bacterium]|jgi:serine/threonine protein kinase|nr:protein kinase [Holosporales bacterium]